MKSLPHPIRRPRGARFSDCLIAATIAVLIVPAAWSQALEVIDLHYRTAAEVIPVLQPLVEPGGALSGQDYKLFARVSKPNLAQLRQALAAIDRQARQLLVSVKNGTRQEMEQEHVAVTGELSTARSSASVQASQSSGNREGEGISTVRVLDGGTASIAVGQTVPVVTSVAAGGGRRPFAASTLGYRELTSGYLVTPRLAGDRVTLQIEQQSQQPGGPTASDTTQTLSTQVSGRLGEWIRLGGIDESAVSSQTGVFSRRYETQSGNRVLWVRVESAD